MSIKYSPHLQFIKPIAKRIYYGVRQNLFKQGIVNFQNQGKINFIDVGSVGWLPEPWFTHAKHVKHLLKFEPRDNSNPSPNIISIDTALWCDNKTLDFYVYEGLGGQGSSLFEQNIEYVQDNYETLQTRGLPILARSWFDYSKLSHVEKIHCRRLDDVLAENPHLPPFHLLKIDAQGAEYEILQGAKSLLSQSCVGLHLELFTLPLYKGITLLPTVAEYLEEFGFRLVKKMPPHGSFDSQHDCIFLKEGIDNEITNTIKQVYALE